MQTKHDSYNLMTSGEVANLIGVSVDTIRRWEKSGKVAALFTPTGHRRFRREDVERLLQPSAPSAPEQVA